MDSLCEVGPKVIGHQADLVAFLPFSRDWESNQEARKLDASDEQVTAFAGLPSWRPDKVTSVDIEVDGIV